MPYHLSWQRLEGERGHDVGRRLLAQLYTDRVGGPMPPIGQAPMGKPFFEDSPWHFSISHSQNHAFCVLSEGPVGIDGEELSRRVDPALAGRILSPGELRQYEAAADKNRALLTFWVLKEAAGKCSGRGISTRPNGTDFSLDDPRVQEIDGCLVAILTENDSV